MRVRGHLRGTNAASRLVENPRLSPLARTGLRGCGDIGVRLVCRPTQHRAKGNGVPRRHIVDAVPVVPGVVVRAGAWSFAWDKTPRRALRNIPGSRLWREPGYGVTELPGYGLLGKG